MMIKHPRVKTEDLLFYIAYGVFLIFGILSTSFYYRYFSSIYTLIKYFCMAILIYRELLIHKYNIKSLFIGAVFVVLILITRTQSSLATVTYILIFLFCARNVDFNGLIRFSAWVSSVVVLFIVASSYLGIIENYVNREASRVRYYLGFRYSLYGPAFIFNITALFIYLKKENIQWLSLFILTLLNCWMYLMTRSRLSFVLSLVLIFGTVIFKLFPNFLKRKLFGIVMIFSFVICFCVSLYFTVTYDASVAWQTQLNNIVENRLYLGQSAIDESGITLFGQRLELVGNGLDENGRQNTEDTYNYVDSLYIQILLRYGIIFTVIWIALLTYALFYFYKKGDYWLLFCMMIIAIHCIMDDLSMELYYNTFWFAISMAIPSLSENYLNFDLLAKLRKEDNSIDSNKDRA